jgi:hypothetical protein
MDRARETQRLREYERELVEAVLADNPADVRVLRGLVAAFRTALGEKPAASKAQRRPKTPGTGLKATLKLLLGERDMLSVEEAVDAVGQLAQYRDNPPTRGTIVSRLGDLVRDGDAESLRRGVYAAIRTTDEPPTNGSGSANRLAFQDSLATTSEGEP